MTDEQILQAFNYCFGEAQGTCKECPFNKYTGDCCETELQGAAVDLINRLKADNERLKIGTKNLVDKQRLYKENVQATREFQIEQAKTEAHKEFAERLKANAVTVKIGEQNCRVITVDGIDYLLKERVGEG
jgi:hypothetical protein